MIQAAASSPPSSLALGTGTPSAAGDDAANSGAFATALTASMTPGQDETKAGAASATDTATGQTSGKAAGKILPDATALAGSGGTTSDATAVGTTAPVAPPIASEIILPGLVIPAKAQPTQADKPAAEPSATENVAKTIAALLVRAPKSAPVEEAPAKPAKTAGKTEETASATDDDAPATTTAAVATVPLPFVIPVALSVATQPVETKAASVTTARPTAAPAAVTVAAAPGKEQVPADAPAIATAAPAAAESAAQIVVNFALPQAAPKQAPAAAKPTVEQLAAYQPNATANTQPDAAVAKPEAPTAPATSLSPATGTTEQHGRAATHDAAAAAKNDAIGDAPAAKVSAEALALPTVTNAPAIAQTVAPVAAASGTGAAHLSSHDFTALVDRLVEAREAASPQGVNAAISHSEFGQVSLRFDQDANGLSVSMTSADPDFARAVQAGTASAGSQATGDNGSAPHRDAQGHQQQAAGSSSGQAQSQAQSQAYSRDDRSQQTRTEFRTAARQTPETDHDDASGDIFA